MSAHTYFSYTRSYKAERAGACAKLQLSRRSLGLRFFLSLAVFWFMSSFLLQAQAKSTNPDAILGAYQTYDDKTGNKKALVKVSYDKKTGTYFGRIKKITPAPGYKPKTHCQNCPKPFTGQKIEGMLLFWNLKPVNDSAGEFTGEYDGGYIIDPLNGKIYKIRAAKSATGRVFKFRAYVGISAIGRTQSWVKID